MPKDQASEMIRNTDSVETVVWRVKTPSSAIDLSVSSEIEMSANSVATVPTTTTVNTASISNLSNITAPNMPIASTSGISEHCKIKPPKICDTTRKQLLQQVTLLEEQSQLIQQFSHNNLVRKRRAKSN